jgi:hypothetical protein
MPRMDEGDTSMSDKPDPYFEFRLTAQGLEDDGIPTTTIIDAMLCVGLNAGKRYGGSQFVCDYMREMIALFENGSDLDTQTTTH